MRKKYKERKIKYPETNKDGTPNIMYYRECAIQEAIAKLFLKLKQSDFDCELVFTELANEYKEVHGCDDHVQAFLDRVAKD